MAGGANLGLKFGDMLDSGKLLDPGDGGTVVIGGVGFGVLHIASATDTVVLPAAAAGTIVMVVNESGGTIAINDAPASTVLDADLADDCTEICVYSGSKWSSEELELGA
ncbi:MAG: hypothetical protein DRH08_12255 [Deltaproteobacteria bacterium]|nr:MAG: hypothetical protein DRH08_12255 [Deltaproteobacteria bacterium]